MRVTTLPSWVIIFLMFIPVHIFIHLSGPQMPEPPQLSLLKVEEQLLPDIRALRLNFKTEQSHPVKETHLCRLYSQSCSFGHCPRFMTIGDGWNVDWPLKWELRLHAQLSFHHNGPVWCPHHCRSQSVILALHVPLTCEQDTCTPPRGAAENHGLRLRCAKQKLSGKSVDPVLFVQACLLKRGVVFDATPTWYYVSRNTQW